MKTALCPRCQKQVLARQREVVDEVAHTRRRETTCAECGALLEARTEPLPPGRED